MVVYIRLYVYVKNGVRNDLKINVCSFLYYIRAERRARMSDKVNASYQL